MMLRTVVRLSPAVLPILQHLNENDRDYLNTKKSDEPTTGFERLKKMYRKNEYDEYSTELHTVIQSSLCGAFFGACMGGFFKSRDAYFYFIDNNQATIFNSTAQAKKRLQDSVTVAFAQGAARWGWRLGAFTGLFSFIATTISVYRGDTSLIQYVTAGAMVGAFYKCNLGLAATIVGAGLGATLSTVGGLAILGLLKVTGVEMDDIRRALYSIKEAREEQFRQAQEKASEIKNDELTKHHDLMVEEKGEKKIDEL